MVLDVKENKITDEGVVFITGSNVFSNLNKLFISNNNLGSEGAKVLAEATNLSHLQYLDISYNRIGNDGWKAIADSEAFPVLNGLYIYHGNEIDEFTKKYLQKSKTLKNLSSLK